MGKQIDFRFLSSAITDEAVQALQAFCENPRLAIYYEVQDDWVTIDMW